MTTPTPRQCPKCETTLEAGAYYCPFCGWGTGGDAGYRYYYYWSDWLIQFSIAVSYIFLVLALGIWMLAAVWLSAHLFWTGLGFTALAGVNLLVQNIRRRHRRLAKAAQKSRER